MGSDVSRRGVGMGLLVASGFGFPATQLVIRRYGRRGAVLAQMIVTGLLVHDIVLITQRERRVLSRPSAPSALLVAEATVAAVAAAGNVRLLVDDRALEEAAAGWSVGVGELVRRLAMGTLFGFHTLRSWICR